MDLSRPEALSAADAARALHDGALSAEALVDACLRRIRETEPTVQAWQHLDEAHALAQARARDLDRAQGRPCGPLHGLPVGVKDIIDTADMPTEDGTELHAGRTPAHDAWVVARLRAAGAVILGKTVTTELATYRPSRTRNPHDPARSPGGSSAGSAAAVAAGMVPLAIGTQTNGSVIRPASYCGVVGFKPTQGLIGRDGILKTSPTLDCVGLVARSVADIALLAEPLTGHDPRDAATQPRAALPFVRLAAAEPPLPPKLAFVKTAAWPRADAETQAAFGELVDALGGACDTVDLPASLSAAWDWHRTIMEAEMAACLDTEWQRGRDRLSEGLRQQLERGRAVPALAYQQALAQIARLNAGFDEIFDRYDALVTPATTGTAPALDSTGDPVFCTLWSLAGMPALSLPLMRGGDGMPLGVQLVGARHGDARLLRTASWLQAQLAGR